MVPFKPSKIALFTAVFLSVLAVAEPGITAFHYTPHPYTTDDGSQGESIQWPSDSISVSQMQGVFNQFPGVSNFNFQFPNQTNWATTPAAVQNIYDTLQQKAQALGVGTGGKVPDLSFSSLAGGGVQGDMMQLAIDKIKSGDAQAEMGDLLNQFQSGNLSNSLSSYMDMLPDWLKTILMTIYNAIYACFDFLQSEVQAMFR